MSLLYVVVEYPYWNNLLSYVRFWAIVFHHVFPQMPLFLMHDFFSCFLISLHVFSKCLPPIPQSHSAHGQSTGSASLWDQKFGNGVHWCSKCWGVHLELQQRLTPRISPTASPPAGSPLFLHPEGCWAGRARCVRLSARKSALSFVHRSTSSGLHCMLDAYWRKRSECYDLITVFSDGFAELEQCL